MRYLKYFDSKTSAIGKRLEKPFITLIKGQDELLYSFEVGDLSQGEYIVLEREFSGNVVPVIKSGEYSGDSDSDIFDEPHRFMYYTTIDGKAIPTPNVSITMTPISNTYENGYGVLEFDHDVFEVYNFENCTTLKTIVLPETVWLLVGGEHGGAFKNCKNLTSVNLENIYAMASDAFVGCSSLTSIVLPKGIQVVGSLTFKGCTSLKSVTIPDSVVDIAEDAFADCPSGIVINYSGVNKGYPWGGKVTTGRSIRYNAPYRISVEKLESDFDNVVVEESYDSEINNGYVLFENEITTISNEYVPILEYVPYTVSDILYKQPVNASNSGLTSIYFPDGITEIEANSYGMTRTLKEISIPSSVTTIGERAFFETSLEKIIFRGTKSQWELINKGTDWATGGNIHYVVFCTDGYIDEYGNEVITYTTNSSNEFKKVGYYRISGEELKNVYFQNRTDIITVDIPSQVTIIGNDAFRGCENLKTVNMPETVTIIGESAFRDCSSLVMYEVPRDVMTIGMFAFSGCKSFTRFAIYNNVRMIGNCAFQSCTKLYKFSINKQLLQLGEKVFIGCTSLYSINFKGYVSEWNAISKKPYWEAGSCLYAARCVDGNVVINEYYKHYDYDYDSFEIVMGVLKKYKGFGPHVDIPSNVRVIGSTAFDDCKESIKTVNIPDGVYKIEDNAFRGCKYVYELHLPETITEIGKYAFAESNISKINIPEGVSVISEGLFYRGRFNGYPYVPSILPKEVDKIEDNAFAWCSTCGYNALHLPKIKESLGNNVFYQTYPLTRVPGALCDIYYNGTKSEWNNLNKPSDWNANSLIDIIHCTNGDIRV